MIVHFTASDLLKQDRIVTKRAYFGFSRTGCGLMQMTIILELINYALLVIVASKTGTL
jgi:hypothetical protein